MREDRRQDPRASAPEKRGRRPEEPSETSGNNSSENAHWQALLKQLGLETLQLPSDGTLAGPWKEFLEQFEAKESRMQRTKKERH